MFPREQKEYIHQLCMDSDNWRYKLCAILNVSAICSECFAAFAETAASKANSARN